MAGKYRNYFYAFNKYLLSAFPDNLFHNAESLIMHVRFKQKFHWLNVKKPRTFSEKLQYLKNKGNISEKTKLADKYDVREFIEGRIGKKYLVDLNPCNSNGDLCVNSTDKIDWDLLPNQFALKLTKGSGFNIICQDKSKLNKDEVMNTLNRWLKINNYIFSREPQYKGKNQIICETLLKYNITDYKFFCFNGEPKFVELYIDRFGNHRKVFYDMEWKKAGFTTAGDSMDGTAEKPNTFEEMKSLAKILSKDFPFARIDLYEHDNKVYFGEITFHPAGGYTPITPREWDYKLGDMIDITNV